MPLKTVIYLIITVLSVSAVSDQRENIKVKRGKYYSSPSRFYNQPPMVIPIKGPFSYTPPPYLANDDAPYPGRPYKVSKRPVPLNNDGLGDDDIANLVKYMSKQDFDKILEYAQSKNQRYNKYKYIDTQEYNRPYKQESYKGNGHVNYEPTSYNEESLQFFNHITEPANANFLKDEENQYPKQDIRSTYNPVTQRTNEVDNLYSNQEVRQPISSITNNNYETESKFINIYDEKTSHFDTENYVMHNQMAYAQQIPVYPTSNGPVFTETNEEERLPPPINMREDYEASYTNNVQKIEKPDSYDVKNFGELPLMDYNSKLHDVSSYHVPHYTVTQPKSPNRNAPSIPISFSSGTSYSSSPSLLKPSPASVDISEPIYEKAPSLSAAAQQSDAHLKAVKIWSYKSKGSAYTLHDDGSLSPERPKYG